jgi:hypothetical protein
VSTETLAQPLTKNGYGQYLLRVLKEKVDLSSLQWVIL